MAEEGYSLADRPAPGTAGGEMTEDEYAELEVHALVLEATELMHDLELTDPKDYEVLYVALAANVSGMARARLRKGFEVRKDWGDKLRTAYVRLGMPARPERWKPPGEEV